MKALALLCAGLLAGFSFGQGAPNVAQLRDQMIGKAPAPSKPIPTGAARTPSANPQADAKQILSNPLYRDEPSTSGGDSWLADAFRKIGERIAKLFEDKSKRQQQPAVGLPFGDVITYVVIGLLCAVLLGFIVFALSKVRFKSKSTGEGGEGLVDEEEIGRTADEWLVHADRLAKDGDYRSAVRCLYLACLTRLDEANVLRLERHETNWEHLGRYQSVVAKPGGFDLRPPTQRFDQAWYGLVPQGPDDLEWFNTEYRRLMDGIKGVAR
ncbi:MAG: hypothetical protein JSS71_08220 [Armatimonadetes bacterium]|nr:hypothetical protein [Armatimonadota bacterium]MBX3109751.1 hypothetical protein [Fimbriimonadaceae bacterium]